jgi:hypothetical protein
MDSECTQSENEVVTSSDNFNFKCKVCGKNLSSRQNLKEHFYTHTGERPYVCEEEGCGQSFRQGSLLSIHRRIHKEVNGNQRLVKVRKEIKFLQLTQVLKGKNSIIDRPISEDDKKYLLSSISNEDFSFVKKFLK